MPLNNCSANRQATPSVTKIGEKGRGFVLARVVKVLALLLVLSMPIALSAATAFDVVSAPSGFAISGTGQNYSATFGTLNALAVGNPTVASVTVIPLSNGALYYSTIEVKVKIPLTNPGYFEGMVWTNFTHTAALTVYSCPSTSACNAAGSYSALSTNLGSPSVLVPKPGLSNGQTAVFGLAIFVPDNNGASAYAGTDTATIAIGFVDSVTNGLLDFAFVSLTPSEVLETAVRLNLASAPSGVTIAPAADYSLNFGTVNALGIAPGVGLTTSNSPGGIIYSTPYQILPEFADFTSTTSTVNVCVSTTFTHSAVLMAEDSSSGAAGSFVAISTTCGVGSNSIATAAVNRSTITRYLGLFVSNANGATAFTGVDKATLTYTLTVP